MGYIRHHAIVVTSWDADRLSKAHAKATKLCSDLVTPMASGRVNGYASFLIAPDGSKEGWEESNTADVQRAKFIEWLDRKRYDDGSSPYDWVEVQYGDDNLQTRIVDDSDAPRRRQRRAERGEAV